MKNNTKSIITIEMNHVDHATKMTETLRRFFKISSQGGDCHLAFMDDTGDVVECGVIGHDVRQPIISLEFQPTRSKG